MENNESPYQPDAPVLFGQKALKLMATLPNDIKYDPAFKAQCKEAATFRAWSNDEAPFAPDTTVSPAYWVRETDVKAAVEAFTGVPLD